MDQELLIKAYKIMYAAKQMAEVYESNRPTCKYVHSTSRGHEAIQIATAFHLQPYDYVSPYYRDESMLMGLGYSAYDLMLQLLTKGDDGFSGGRSYYSHPANRQPDKPTIIHQSSATGMQAIPTTGVAQGIQYLETSKLRKNIIERPVILCSMGDASVTEGEVSEAFQFAVLKQLPIIYLVQDNNWGISVSSKESRTMDVFEYAEGFKGMNRLRVDGCDFTSSWEAMRNVFLDVREHRRPWVVHARVSLLNHHTSGVRKEFYRTQEDLDEHYKNDPLPRLRFYIAGNTISEEELRALELTITARVKSDFEKALKAGDPDPNTIERHIFAATPATEEKGERAPANKTKVMMVDAALFAIREIMEEHPNVVVYGQDVGRRLGGVFRETATLAEHFGDNRVFNTAIQEAYIIGSTAGMSAVGVKPIVEVQFGDYIFPGINQLVSEVSKSCYLTNGKFPVGAIIRVPVGAYGGGGPYHSGCLETMLLAIKGIKIAYPSNAADMKGLLKAAFLDPNPILMLEHKGLYWSKVPGTEDARTIEPARDYILPFGKAATVVRASEDNVARGKSCCVVTYGMGVYWAKSAARSFPAQIEVIDLRTLYPLDEDYVFEAVKKHGRCIVLTEEQQNNSFAEALASRIAKNCFRWLDAPVEVMGALNLPAVPLNIGLETAMLPNAVKLSERLVQLLAF